MDVMNMKSMIQKNIVDFSELVLNNYHKIGLDETDAIIIIKLSYLLKRQITFIHPKNYQTCYQSHQAQHQNV